MEIIHCEQEFLVVNKPGDLLAVPGRGSDKQDCVVNRIKELYPDCIQQPAVHRLDMATSGLMLLARTQEAHTNLSRQFEQRKVKKEYIALVEGKIVQEQGTIELSFRLDPDNRPYQIYDPIHGKPGITHWKNLGQEGQRTRIRFLPVTGRTHQLRLHAAHEKGLASPICGDFLYGNGRDGAPMLLHASMISFFHPSTGNQMEFRSPPAF